MFGKRKKNDMWILIFVFGLVISNFLIHTYRDTHPYIHDYDDFYPVRKTEDTKQVKTSRDKTRGKTREKKRREVKRKRSMKCTKRGKVY